MTQPLKNPPERSAFRHLRSALVPAALLLAAASALTVMRSSAEEARAIPAPAHEGSAGHEAMSEVAVIAGGCFWGVQGVYQHVKGVTNAVSGYAGGEKKSAAYEVVGTGSTGHAESVQVTFDPRVVSYGRLLQIFFSVAHDPTQLDRQGPDSGPQYRSAIFPANPEQVQIAKAYIGQLDAAGIYKYPIVTTIESGRTVYPAEKDHQDYMTGHPRHPEISVN